ncbi:hypothetical protein BJY04DRAFT_199413 [Aspergillus karnatakaensis]|uniref:DUF4863 family protein n=1 Tax=Aspergillus karnatakaensis TaxID=1810916 RepID=UPI003CCD16F5
MTELHPNAEKLIACARDFFTEVSDLTPGKNLENHLNEHYGPGTPIYDTLSNLITTAIKENEPWLATDELDGRKYRRSRLLAPSEETRYFSITTVYMDSVDVYRGQYHLHPYGEINCVIPIDENAEIRGMNGWMGKGWTSPAAGTHHYPEVRGGALVAVFFLPAGRISYKASPGMEQPGYV